jgi:hypothetical protein
MHGWAPKSLPGHDFGVAIDATRTKIIALHYLGNSRTIKKRILFCIARVAAFSVL